MTIMEREDKKALSSKKKKKKKQHLMFYKLLSFFLIVLSVVTFGYMIYEEIFSLFYMIPIVIVSMIIIFFITSILNKERLRRWIKNIFSLLAIIILFVEALMLLFGTKTIKFFTSLTDNGYRVETFGVYVLNISTYKKVGDLDGKKINYLNHEDDTNIRKALSKIEKKISVDTDYNESSYDLLKELIDNNVDAILIDTTYESVLKEDYPDEFGKIRLLEEIDIVDMINTLKSDVDITKDPFAVYISGIDTTGNVGSKARSDVNIVLAVNPKTKNVLMINTPRDYYVTLHSKQKKDKLTHSGLYGVEESLKTLEDLYDMDIDYYTRINFTSFVKIVNELGGISVDVPKHFCEQNSKRSFESKDLICLNKGRQTLNGEQALALARHRHTLPDGDRGRGNNQMLILEAILKKAMTPKIITKFNSLTAALEGKVTTNMSSKEMIKFVDKNKNNTANWNFNSISVTGKDSSGVCYATGSGKAYVMEPDKSSLSDAKIIIDNLFEGKENVMELPTTTTTTTTVTTKR